MTALIGFPSILGLAALALLSSAFAKGRTKKIWRAAAAWCFVVGFGLLAWNAFTLTPSGVTQVETRLGQVAAKAKPPGLHMVHPFSKLTPMTIRPVVFDWTRAGALVERGPQGDLMVVEAAAQVRLDAAYAPMIYAQIGDDAAWRAFSERVIRAAVIQVLSESDFTGRPADMSTQTLSLARTTLRERLAAAGFSDEAAEAAIRLDGLDLVSIRPVVHGCARELASL